MEMNVMIVGKYAVMVLGYSGDISFLKRRDLDSLSVGDEIKDVNGNHIGSVVEKTNTKIVIE